MCTHTEQPGVLGVRMKALLFTSGDLKHAGIGEPENARAKHEGGKRHKVKNHLGRRKHAHSSHGLEEEITNQESLVTVTISHSMTTVRYTDLQVPTGTQRDQKGTAETPWERSYTCSPP